MKDKKRSEGTGTQNTLKAYFAWVHADMHVCVAVYL